MRAFLKFYFKNVGDLVEEIGYVPLDKAIYDKELNEIK